MAGNCTGDHTYFVADVAIVLAEGKVIPIALCTSCGNVVATPVKVADSPNSEIKLEKFKENK
jgi:uncharacterized OB-fold protein